MATKRIPDLPEVGALAVGDWLVISREGVTHKAPANPDATGASAYEVGVDNGFVGTEAQWLASIVGPQGPKGDTGNQGIQGPQGIKGDAGPKGDMGDIGPKGDQGIQGTQGPKGDIGLQGTQGIQGPQGSIGPKGDIGEQGVQGPVGSKGDKGDKGDTGIQGPQGDTGSYAAATPSADGLMSASDKIKLDGVASGSTGQILLGDGSASDYVPNAVMGLSYNMMPAAPSISMNHWMFVTDGANYGIRQFKDIAATYAYSKAEVNSLIPGDATTSSKGLMSAADKVKLDAVGSMANRSVTISTGNPSGGVNGDAWFKV